MRAAMGENSAVTLRSKVLLKVTIARSWLAFSFDDELMSTNWKLTGVIMRLLLSLSCHSSMT